MRTRWLGVIAAVVMTSGHVSALLEQPDDRDIARALNIANAGDVQRAMFHRPYLVAVADPVIEQLEVITEFRRVVLAAEDEIKSGNWVLARGGYDAKGRTLRDLLRSKAGHAAIRVRLRFHPLNAYLSLPPVDILLGEPTLLPVETVRTPHVAPATDAGFRDVITGATIETAFNALSVGDRLLPVRIVLEGKEVVRAEVDFSRVE